MRDLTQDELDAIAGAGKGRTHSYETGDAQPSVDYLIKVAPYLGLASYKLIYEPLEIGSGDDPVEVPYWGVVPCGSWEAPTGDPDIALVSGRFRGVPDIVAVRASGQSMMPLYRPGQTVPIKLSRSSRDGVVSLVHNEHGDLALKVARSTAEGWEFVPINPAYQAATGEKITLLGHAAGIPELVDLDGISA